ncbi:hypothetical protein J437_LFUL019077 [Ladona fulva]|uniref:Uncharacterized protein n=1 Tax=Ladona fulva TaxID=123851 RepID=A0A8K0PAN2_LADFU|nr:hypothetical protein J437_LFUL019077 [Ladona fulva]
MLYDRLVYNWYIDESYWCGPPIYYPDPALAMSRNNVKDKSEGQNRRVHSIMNQDDIASGKRSNWSELEISGKMP